jgi:glucose/mannose transport system permease protein
MMPSPEQAPLIAAGRRRLFPHRSLTSMGGARLALLPAFLVLVFVYLGTTVWTIWLSLTNSTMLPRNEFVGLRQYDLLGHNDRWLTSVENLAIFGFLMIALALSIGFVLAAAIDRKIRGENALRSIFLYPYSMSFIVNGLIFQWLLNPTLGIQKLVRGWGFPGFQFDWIVRQDTAIYCLVIAAVWHAAGLAMVIMLAGLRGISEDIWKAARVDGLPTWRIYRSIVIPMMAPSFATAGLLLAMSVVRLYDLPVAMTNGGPGFASEVPAKFIMDTMFDRGDLGLATAAAASLLVTAIVVVAPFLYLRSRRPEHGGRR